MQIFLFVLLLLLIRLHLCNIQCSSSCAYNIVKYEMRNTEMNKMRNIQGNTICAVILSINTLSRSNEIGRMSVVRKHYTM